MRPRDTSSREGQITHESALGRLVPETMMHLLLQDDVLSVLIGYYLSEQNPHNEPMAITTLARAVNKDVDSLLVVLAVLIEEGKVEEREMVETRRTFGVTEDGVLWGLECLRKVVVNDRE